VQALYKAWDATITATGRDSVLFGHANWSLNRPDTNQVGFGRGGSPDFIVHKDGRFRFAFPFHGAQQRNIIMRTIPFLGWGWTHSRYQWYVDFDVNINLWSYQGSMHNGRYERELHYVSEDLMGARTYGQPRPWCVLEKDANDAWTIQLAKKQYGAMTNVLAGLPDLRHRWARYDKIRAKRYDKERQIANGTFYSPVSVAPPTMRSNNQPLPPEQAVERLAALFSIDQPARTTPLKKPKEATHHGYHMATTSQL